MNDISPITYKNAGVDIDAGERAVELIKDKVRRTFSPRVLTDLGGFSGLFTLKDYPAAEPVLVSGTDSVGTKLKIAFMMNKHDTVGIDAVAMCVNDAITCGAQPLFFLDYIGTGKLRPETVSEILDGVVEGCLQARCALIGGEMAEMPGIYAEGEYDLVGFCVGIADRSKIIDGSTIRAGDVVLGLPSSGLHSNGFSLVRKVLFDIHGFEINKKIDELGGKALGEILLTPTRIYVDVIMKLKERFPLRGIAHITGGGLVGNIIRIIPKGLALDIHWGNWTIPPVFGFIQKAGNITDEEMRKVFNLGIGMAIIAEPETAKDIKKYLAAEGRGCYEIGAVQNQ